MTTGPTADLRAMAMELTALAESGLAYCRDDFDIERFHRVGELARDLMQEVATDSLPAYDREVASAACYMTPKLDLRAGVFDPEGRVLLVREVADDDRWTLPGGWCDIHESPRRAIERDVDHLPELSVSRVVPEQVALLREHWRRPGPAHVD